jgi:hypothetical protein
MQRAVLLRKLIEQGPQRTFRHVKHRLIGGGGRPRIPGGLSIAAFLDQLERCGCNYVVLRWFEGLPDVEEGEDIDILVYDADVEKVVSLLVTSSDRALIACDVRSVHGLPGTSCRGTACYPPGLAERVLARAVRHQSGARVPCAEDHFYSLAFHALYHKGYKSGLPLSDSEGARQERPEHPYTEVLAALARSVGIRVAITMQDLHREFGARGWQPPVDSLVKWSRRNDYCAELMRRAAV